MRHRRSAAAFAGFATAAMAVAGQPVPAAAAGATVHHVVLEELNESGVSGRVTLVQKGEVLRVNLNVHGLEAGQLHVHHIHGFGDGTNATCPDMSAADDLEDDGVVDIAEGLPFYGPVVVSLGADVTEGSTLAYSRTFQETDAGAAIPTMGDLDQYAVVVHGLTVNGQFVASTPVACAVITENGR